MADVKRYIDWHFEHVNSKEEDYNGVEGTIYDYQYTVKNGNAVSETSLKNYDSTDSYSALFFELLNEYYKQTNDVIYITENKDKIDMILNAMFSTMKEGYYMAKPDYPYKILMDNCEVHQGLKSAENIYKNLFDDENTLNKIKDSIFSFENNFNKIWWKGSYYAPVLDENNNEVKDENYNWKNFYEFAAPQLYPIIYDLVSNNGDIARDLYKKFALIINGKI